MEIGSDSLKQLHDVLNKLKKEEKESARTEKSASENKASKNKTSENNSDRKHASKNEETSDLHDDGQDKKEKQRQKTERSRYSPVVRPVTADRIACSKTAISVRNAIRFILCQI